MMHIQAYIIVLIETLTDVTNSKFDHHDKLILSSKINPAL